MFSNASLRNKGALLETSFCQACLLPSTLFLNAVVQHILIHHPRLLEDLPCSDRTAARTVLVVIITCIGSEALIFALETDPAALEVYQMLTHSEKHSSLGPAWLIGLHWILALGTLVGSRLMIKYLLNQVQEESNHLLKNKVLIMLALMYGSGVILFLCFRKAEIGTDIYARIMLHLVPVFPAATIYCSPECREFISRGDVSQAARNF